MTRSMNSFAAALVASALVAGPVTSLADHRLDAVEEQAPEMIVGLKDGETTTFYAVFEPAKIDPRLSLVKQGLASEKVTQEVQADISTQIPAIVENCERTNIQGTECSSVRKMFSVVEGQDMNELRGEEDRIGDGTAAFGWWNPCRRWARWGWNMWQPAFHFATIHTVRFVPVGFGGWGGWNCHSHWGDGGIWWG